MNRSRLEGLAEWNRKMADETEAFANRLGEKHETHMELLRDAAQHRQTVHQIESILAEADGEQEVVGEFVGYGRVTGEPHVRMKEGLSPGSLLYTHPRHRGCRTCCSKFKKPRVTISMVTDELSQLQGVAAELEYADGMQAHRHHEWCKRIRDAVAALAAKAGGR